MENRAFTQQYNGIVNSLRTPAGISSAFDPRDTHVTQPTFIQFNALWDTGAEKSVITKEVAEKLGLIPSGQARVCHANGSDIVNTYLVSIALPNSVVFPQLRVSEGILSGFDVLIGMDIIACGDFAITCSQQKTKFTFQVPSSHDLDFVKESQQTHHTPIVAPKKIGRNDPCPCGSGKKYKNCHGANN